MSIATEMKISLRAEYQGAELGDHRRTQRLCDMAEAVAAKPDASIPTIFPDTAGREAAYRFLRNDKVSHEAVLDPHKQQTAKRARDAGAVIVSHDTTEFNFGTKGRKDLGNVGRGKSHGFYAHVSMAVERSDERLPLGVVAVQTHSRDGKLKREGKKSHSKRQQDPDNEGIRWIRGVELSAEALEDCPEIIHVMDREADNYALFSALMQRNDRFVIRCCYDRCTVGDEHGKISRVLEAAPVVEGTREVHLSRRDASALPSQRKIHPPRKARDATLAICAATVTVPRPKSSNLCPQRTLTLNLVRVFEPHPPEGEEPVQWDLWTTEPIDTPEQIWAIVDAYRTRWVIEEYFKVLKTGCAFEARQLESEQNLLRALSLFIPIAWWLLTLRTLSHTDPERPAETLITPVRLHCLRGALRKVKVTLPAKPSVRDVLLGIARLGGHIPRNGEPGWIVLLRGVKQLLLIEEGYLLGCQEKM